MIADRFDRLLWAAIAAAAIVLAVLLARGAGGEGEAGDSLNRALERELAYQARVALLQKLYGPVEELRRAGRPQEALLQLGDLARRYPGEAHGQILKGEILREMGALEEAVDSFVGGVRMNGDYIDRHSPLSRRQTIQDLVEEGLARVGERARLQPDNRSLGVTLRNLYYLQSRLAGGCE